MTTRLMVLLETKQVCIVQVLIIYRRYISIDMHFFQKRQCFAEASKCMVYLRRGHTNQDGLVALEYHRDRIEGAHDESLSLDRLASSTKVMSVFFK